MRFSKNLKFIFTFVLFCLLNKVFSQTKTAAEILSAENEIKINKLNELLSNKDTVLLLTLINNHFPEAKAKKNDALLTALYTCLGHNSYYRGRTKTAILYFDSAAIISRKNNYYGSLGIALMNKGAANFNLNRFSNALKDYLECEKILHKIKSEQLGGLLSNIALLYQEIGDLKSAKDYLYKSFPFVKIQNQKDALAMFYNNLGLIYQKENNFKGADSVFRIGLVISKENNLIGQTNDIVYNLVDLMINNGNYKEANEFAPELYISTKAAGDKSWLKLVGMKIAKINLNLKKPQEAEKYLREAEALAWEEETPNSSKIEYLTGVSQVYFGLGQFQKAADNAIKANQLENTSKTANDLAGLQQLKFKYEKQQDSLALSKQKEIDDLYQQNMEEQTNNKLHRQMLFIWAAVIGFIVVVVFSLFLMKAIKTKERANKEILLQKKLILEKSEEITASINYAKHIQQSLLPTNNDLRFFLPNHFLIYMPKDIVSGDFYWLKKINESEFFVAIADCTGHGVPGAIMSALSIQQLNEISDKYSEPSEILGHLNLKIKSNLNQDAIGFSKDGLDICLCKVNTKTKKIVYAGANRSLWIFDKNGLQRDVKPTKAGIAGHTPISQSYAQTEISVQPEDLILLSTDGFADQFGGDKNKKVTTKLFKEWVAEIYTSTDSKQLLESKYLAWKKNVEQIDDVCVLGFKLV